ncbi:hypothetical protein H5410_014905 [Solanum commersonii]|uniref:Uncharacterized protein n=1 Tax=Solanum commersonii TaxID=4109 RepID=A0A9J5ZS89_SOLCO|nr:hypothetical protein H5410_014905 [Solanum commersonii]
MEERHLKFLGLAIFGSHRKNSQFLVLKFLKNDPSQIEEQRIFNFMTVTVRLIKDSLSGDTFYKLPEVTKRSIRRFHSSLAADKLTARVEMASALLMAAVCNVEIV